MKIEKNSKLYLFIEEMINDITFDSILTKDELELLQKVSSSSRYRKRHKRKLNQIREKWIMYNR